MTKYTPMTATPHIESCFYKRQCPLRKFLRRKFFVVIFFLIFMCLLGIHYQIQISDPNIEYTVNDTMIVCYENFHDKRKVQSLLQQQNSNARESTSTTTTTTSSVADMTGPGNTLTETSSSTSATANTSNTGSLTIYFVTPTYRRSEQIPELIRLGQTLMHVPNLHWIVADDSRTCSSVLENFLNKFGIPFTYLASPMPDIYRNEHLIPRGVANRRAALNWIRTNNIKKGILYFGDDDNTFDLDLFPEIRETKRVSMFPVGLVGTYAVSTPIVRDGKVVGFYDGWPGDRRFPVDMAGFAVNLEYFPIEDANMPYIAGHEEDEFLKSIGLKLEHIEPKAKNCTEILVWHTQAKKNIAPIINPKQLKMFHDTSLSALFESLSNFGVSYSSESKGIVANAINYVKDINRTKSIRH